MEKLKDHNSRTKMVAQTLLAQGRQVFSLQYLHSKMYQWGPEWHIEQTHCINVDSDLRRLKEWLQYPGMAISYGTKVSVQGRGKNWTLCLVSWDYLEFWKVHHVPVQWDEPLGKKSE